MPKVSGLPKVKFNLETKGNATYIHLVFRYQAGRLKRATGEQINPKFWDTETQRAVLDKRHPTQHVQTNDVLDSLAAVVIQIYRDFNLGAISIPDFQNEIDYRMQYKARPMPTTPDTLSMFDFIQSFIEEKKVQPRGTWKILQTVFWLLKGYATERAGGSLDYDKIDFAFFSNFKAWLFAAPRLHSANYAAKVVSVVRQFLREAQRRGYHSKTDYQGFTVKRVKTTKIALSFDELEALYYLDLSSDKRLERVRDLFLIGAYTGLRFSDFTRIRPEHIEVLEGKTILNITTQKTGEQVSIPILSQIPLELLHKYNFEAPKISNQKMNAYLKELGQLAGMTGKMIVTGSKGGKREDSTAEKWEKLTTHVARRSFATNHIRLMRPEQLMKITGHTTEKQLWQYVAIDSKLNALDLADTLTGKVTTRKVAI